MNTGVYKIENTINNKLYIGSTSNLGFKRRWRCHRTSLRRNKHQNQHLQNAWNKYGEQNFKFEIIEKCNPSNCIAREQYYFDILHPQYNILPLAGSCRGYRHSLNAKTKIGHAARGENNPGYLGKFTFYHPEHGYFTGSLVELCKTFGIVKSISYKLRLGTLDKSNGWIYIGKYPCQLPSNIKEYYHNRINNDRQVYSFYHPRHGIFYGTMPEFINKKSIDRSTVSKLILQKRKIAWGWILLGTGIINLPININDTYTKIMVQNTVANSKMDIIHHFYNQKADETFVGTLRNLIEKYNLNNKSAREMIARRKPHLKGWIIKT